MIDVFASPVEIIMLIRQNSQWDLHIVNDMAMFRFSSNCELFGCLWKEIHILTLVKVLELMQLSVSGLDICIESVLGKHVSSKKWLCFSNWYHNLCCGSEDLTRDIYAHMQHIQISYKLWQFIGGSCNMQKYKLWRSSKWSMYIWWGSHTLKWGRDRGFRKKMKGMWVNGIILVWPILLISFQALPYPSIHQSSLSVSVSLSLFVVAKCKAYERNK